MCLYSCVSVRLHVHARMCVFEGEKEREHAYMCKQPYGRCLFGLCFSDEVGASASGMCMTVQWLEKQVKFTVEVKDTNNILLPPCKAYFVFLSPEGRPGIYDVSPLSGISGLSV